jgi:hypothetical protein
MTILASRIRGEQAKKVMEVPVYGFALGEDLLPQFIGRVDF